ncbi:OmpA family protein [Rhizobium leguminosarum]
MGMKSRLFASAAFPLLSLSLALQPASAMAAVRDVATQAAAVRQVEPGSFEVAQDAPSEEELLKKKKHKEQGEAPAEQAPAAEKPAQQEAPAEKPKAERKEAPEPKAEPEAPKAEAPKEVPAEQPESKPERKAKQQAQPEAAPQQEEQPVTQEKPKKPKKQETQQAEPEAQPQPEQQPAAKEAQPETEQAQPEAKPEGGKREKGQDKAQGKDKGKGKAETAAPEAVTPTEEQAKPEAKPEVKPAAEAPAKQKPKGETAAPAENAPAAKTTEDKAAAPEAAPAEKPKDGTAAKPAGEQPAGAQPAAPATDTAQPQPDASGGQQVEQAIPAPEKASPEELERRKKIAADPAKSNETVVLPVENGAAVLDSDKDADRSKGREGRRDRDRQRADSQEVKVPTSDADAQAATGAKAPAPVKLEAVTREKGRKLDERPQFVRPDGARFDDRGDDSRVIIQYDNRTIVRGDDDRRFLRDGERPSYEELSGDRYRETITRPEGYRIVTIRNRYGDIIQRSRVDARGREDVLYYSQDLYDDPDRDYFEDPGADLPPMRLRVPLSDYIIDTRSDPNRDYYEFLSEPPVEPVERVYSLDEVKYSARIRDKVRRIDLDTITFATGSADIPMTQARTLRKVADAISQVLEKDPSETFLIEGHTDAVGSDQSNLILSDQRAESVANVLTDVYGIAPENLATQGYGEHYLKVNTSAPEQENRRVTIRRVTALVRPVAANK